VKKMKECYVALLIDWLHYDAGMDLKQMRDYVNRESLRDLMLEAHIELDEDEKRRGKPMDADKATNEIRGKFEQKKISSPTTVWNNLAEHYITRKHLLPEKTTMNSENAMKRRKHFAQQLKMILNNSKYFVIFIDEMPFYLVMRRSLGFAPKGKRAKTPTLPVGGMSYRTQVAMAVHAHRGVLFGGVFPPQYSQSVSKDGSVGRETLKSCWNKEKFKEYLNGLLECLYTGRDALGLRGKHVILLVDGAPDHGPEKDMPKLLGEREHFRPLKTWLASTGGDIGMLKAPPNSPQLNLYEYYNRILRMHANKRRHDLDEQERWFKEHEHGEKMENRLNLLVKILQDELQALFDTEEGQIESIGTLHRFLDDVIDKDGYLDMHEPM